MVTYNRVDMALISSKPSEVIDLSQQGGIDQCNLVVELPGGGEVQINGCDTANGSFVKAFSVTVPADGVYRSRIPLEAPRFICVASENGATVSVRG